MSTKIYEAYVIENPDLLEKFIKIYRYKCYKYIANTIKKYMSCVNDEYVVKRKSEIKNEVLLKYKRIDDWIRLEKIFKMAWFASKSGVNDPFNFDCSLNIFLYKSKFYIIPYNPSSVFSVPKIDGVKEFCYWNNTDEPENMDHKEWENRGEIWDKITEDWNRYRFSHEIFEGKGMYSRGQYIVEKRILGKGKDDAFLNASFSAAIHAEKEYRDTKNRNFEDNI